MDADLAELIGRFQSLADDNDARVLLIDLWLERGSGAEMADLRDLVARVPRGLNVFPFQA